MSDPSASNSTFDQEVLKLPIFEGKYYSSWSKTMEENLRSDKVGLWDIVENGYERPKDATELATWPDDMKNKYRETDQKRDAEAFRFIQQAVSERIMTEVLTSEKAWDAFKKIRIQSSRQDKTVERYIEEVVSEPQMMELVATSQDAWEILKTLYPSPKDSDEDEVDGIRKMQKASIIVKCSREPKPLEENQMISSGRPKNFKTTSDGEGEMQMDIYQEREEEVTRSGLFRFAMKGDWNKVIEIYTRKAAAHITKITSSGDTALHIAVIDGREDTVQQLVNLMSLEEAKKALRVKNERGNTPLHLAAIVGNVRRLYYCIARKVYPRVEKKREVENNQNQSEKKEVDNDQNPSGKKEVEKEMKNYFPVGERNNDNETPLFLAALLGKKDAFLFLHCCLLDDQGSSYYRRKNGDTVLHVAIYGEYFDLAFQIIHLYPELVNSVNEVGLSPLHCLASRPTAFRSGAHLPLYHRIIYNCTFVEKLEAENLEKYKDEGSNCFTDLPSQDGKNHGYDYPKNYETCVSLISLVNNFFIGFVGTGRVKPRDHRLPTTCAKKESAPGNGLVPPNYGTAFELLKLVWKTILVIIGSGTTEVKRIKLKKEKHIWSVQVLDQILSKVLSYKYENNGKTPRRRLSSYAFDAENNQEITKEIQEATSKIPTKEKRETSILLAAKNGITEIVQKILDQFPVAIQDTNSEKKNVVLLAVENRQPQVYELLLNLAKQNKTKDRIFRQVDDKGNSARHLAAATVGEYKPWRIPGAALQMQWEIKWYKYVKYSMPGNFFPRHNSEGRTSKEIFTISHQELVKSGGEWLASTSESCSVVAALIATVAFATSAAVPGGNKEDSGSPVLKNRPEFKVFAISSLVALCFSVTSVVMFLAILTSRYQPKDFRKDLPNKVLIGLTSLFVSIAAILVCFCAGHFFVLSDELKYAAIPVYGVTCLPVSFFAIAQFPLYIDLVRATMATVPQRSYEVVAAEKHIT